MALNSAFTKLSATLALSSFLLMAPATMAFAANDRCDHPCPNNADCICGPNDTPAVLVNGKWVQKIKLPKKTQTPTVAVTHKATKVTNPMP